MENKITDEQLKQLLAKVFGVETSVIRDDATPDTIEQWDSLRHMNLILALEEEFAVEFSDEQTVEILSYPLIKAVLQEHGVQFREAS